MHGRINLKKMETGMVTVTPKDAALILESMNTFDGQRKIQKNKLDGQTRLMREGYFLPGHAIEFGLSDNDRTKWMLGSGQHRLRAQVLTGYTAVYTVLLHEIPIGTLYAQTDNISAPRTTADRVRALSGVLPGCDDLGETIAARMGNACKAIGKHTQGMTVEIHSDIERLWEMYADQIQQAVTIFSSVTEQTHADYQRYQSAKILGLIIYSMSQGYDYKSFWMDIVNNDGDYNALNTFVCNRANSTSRISSAGIVALHGFDSSEPLKAFNKLKAGQKLQWRDWQETVSRVHHPIKRTRK